MSQRNVFILPGAGAASAASMFSDQGFSITDNIFEADLVQFLGGADVNPALYGHHLHPTTGYDAKRDDREIDIFNQALALGIPMAGICRGGQFLNVMNGGTMFQDVDGHAIHGTHPAYLIGNLVPVQVSSTHHQMMRPNFSPQADCHILLVADLSTERRYMSDVASGISYEICSRLIDGKNHKEDVEAVYYGSTNCLCFQPHPEFNSADVKECRELYFNWIEQYLFCDEQEEVVE